DRKREIILELPSFSRLCQRRPRLPCAPPVCRNPAPAGGRNLSPDAECERSPPAARHLHPGSSPNPTCPRDPCISATPVLLLCFPFLGCRGRRALRLPAQIALRIAYPTLPAVRLHALCAAL